MNIENLHKLIQRYEDNFGFINDSANNEIFKWKAVKSFRDVWFSEKAKSMSFSDMFNLAKKESSVLIDNSQTSPANGIVKLAEKEPEYVEELFTEVLFADDNGDISLRQNNMEKFLEEIEKLRLKYYPQCWKYKQDRHAASCYLVFHAPENNYIYKYSAAEAFAQYIEFGIDIGSGESFKLSAYYKMCDLIVEALKEHESLIEKHFKFLSDECYKDSSLHLLVFDLMYCSRTYNFYSGLSHASKRDIIKAYTEEQLREKERYERQLKIDAISSEIADLEYKESAYSEISLINVQVTQAKYGTGIIVSQNVNRITVRFDDCEKTFVINRKYLGRPTFEDDKEIVDAFTEYDDICDKIRVLKNELKYLTEQI